MERIEAWVRDQNEAREAAEEQVRLARIETERAQMRRLTWEGRRSGKAEKREKKPQKKGIYERFKRLLVKIFQPDTTVQGKFRTLGMSELWLKQG